MLRSKHKARTWPSKKRLKLTSIKQLQPRRAFLPAQELQLQAASPLHAAPADPHASTYSSVAPPFPKRATLFAPPSPVRSLRQTIPSSPLQSVPSSMPSASQHAFVTSRSTSAATLSSTSTHATSMIRLSALMSIIALPKI